MSVNRAALIPVISVNDKRGALRSVISVDAVRDGFIAKADVVRAQDATIAIRLNFMVWAPLYFGKGIADRREMVIPIGKSDARTKTPSSCCKKLGRRARSRLLRPTVAALAQMTRDLGCERPRTSLNC